jgi:hypothetical protein
VARSRVNHLHRYRKSCSTSSIIAFPVICPSFPNIFVLLSLDLDASDLEGSRHILKIKVSIVSRSSGACDGFARQCLLRDTMLTLIFSMWREPSKSEASKSALEKDSSSLTGYPFCFGAKRKRQKNKDIWKRRTNNRKGNY